MVRAAGFDHVSDDDFARVTIAQAWAHAPRLDPTGTSWLPFPFWWLGGVMAIVGRSLEVARAVSIAVASLAAGLPYLAMRRRGASREMALAGAALAYGTPWAMYAGAATVPESVTASLMAAVVLGVGAVDTRAPGTGERAWAYGFAALAACLSRYEVWPMAAVVALGWVWSRRRSDWGLLALVVIGPVLWMMWNAHAHDGPLHFFRRVSAYKRAIGDGATDPLAALLLYPRLLVTTRPEVSVPALLLVAGVLRDPARRKAWGIPLGAVLAQVAFLAYGNLRDGAPAHHPGRVLLGAFVVLAFFVAAEGARVVRARGAWLVMACVGALWLATTVRDLAAMPGRTADEDRSDAVARGRALRGADRVIVTPCAYEHFALIAAYGAPERVETRPADKAQAICPGVR